MAQPNKTIGERSKEMFDAKTPEEKEALDNGIYIEDWEKGGRFPLNLGQKIYFYYPRGGNIENIRSIFSEKYEFFESEPFPDGIGGKDIHSFTITKVLEQN